MFSLTEGEGGRKRFPPFRGGGRERFYPVLRGHNIFWIRDFVFFNCMFYQLLCVQLHSCSSTQSWGSVLPSIVETRDQNSRGCPLLFLNMNLGSLCAQGTEILYTHSLWEVVDHSRSKMHATCLIIIHDPGMRQGPKSNWGPLD